MPRKPTGQPTGRPYIGAYDAIAKRCEACGAEFRLRDKQFQTPARFRVRKFCSVPCANAAKAGLCGGHDAFWARVEKREAAQCWEWQGSITANGYGTLMVDGVKVRAHRHSYELEKGPIPLGKMILHSCDNRRCVNPAHLRPGTAKENVEDAVSRSRMRWQRVAA